MKLIYNKKTKKCEIELLFSDKCFSCGNKSCCALLEVLENAEVIPTKENLDRKDCKMYFYDIDDKLEGKFKGFFFGDQRDLGFGEDGNGNDKYRYR